MAIQIRRGTDAQWDALKEQQAIIEELKNGNNS